MELRIKAEASEWQGRTVYRAYYQKGNGRWARFGKYEAASVEQLVEICERMRGAATLTWEGAAAQKAATPATLAFSMIQEIKADMEAGHVPATAATFSELHDYVDANEYAINALDAAGIEHDAASDEQATLLNRAMDMVNVWLAARR